MARALGVAEKNRVVLAGGESIMHAYHNNRDAFCRYALADVCETRAVASLLSRSYFVQSQMFLQLPEGDYSRRRGGQGRRQGRLYPQDKAIVLCVDDKSQEVSEVLCLGPVYFSSFGSDFAKAR